MPRRTRFLSLAHTIDPERAAFCATHYGGIFHKNTLAHAIATLLGAAYPALVPVLDTSPEIPRTLASEGFHTARDRQRLASRLTARVGALDDGNRVEVELRRFVRYERARIALREILPQALGGADVDVTARELSALADVTIELAVAEAIHALSARFGPPRANNGKPARFVVLGMGKLGGEELNPGSDVDLIYFYDTDDGEAGEGPDAITLHDFWTRVARRLTATLERVTDLGFVWRVDLRLRPEGQRGPLVNSLAAAERYYEAFGRLWERAALLRARPVAGDKGLGDEILAMLSPFIWRRRVDPRIAVEMIHLVERARAELSPDAHSTGPASGPPRDLKHGSGGIREAEFFVQTLQLIWGGKEPRVRTAGTLDALRRLRAAGFVTDRETQEIALGYVALRRAEHAIQTATGIQTHTRPSEPAAEARLACAQGFPSAEDFIADIGGHMKRIAARFLSLHPEGTPSSSRWSEALGALERAHVESFIEAILRAAGQLGSAVPDDAAALERFRDVARDLFELSRHPDAPLGPRSRENYPELAEAVLEAVLEAADPEQAARYLRIFFARFTLPGLYTRLLGQDGRAVRRLVGAFGASAFIGDALVNNPELGDDFLVVRHVPTPEEARAEIEQEKVDVGRCEDPEDALVTALRRAKARVTLAVGLSDLAGEIGTREATHVLSSLADASLDVAVRFALGTPPDEPVRGLAVMAMGKLGGREIGYGSDLDVFFLFDPARAPEGVDPDTFFARSARRIIRLISASHGAGPGYELDTRLRPSGNQGLLVTSLEAFARYHGCDPGPEAGEGPRSVPRVRAAAWERLALLRCRFAAGDERLGHEAMRIAHIAAYEMRADPATVAEEIHRLRLRLERELSSERPGRYDIKFGRGGLIDIEFAVQLLQLKSGRDNRVRTTETAVAIESLSTAGYLSLGHAETLREGYAFLRRLEQRIRILHGSSAHIVDEGAPGLGPLARRMHIRDRFDRAAGAELIARYRAVSERVRAAYEAIVGEAMGKQNGAA